MTVSKNYYFAVDLGATSGRTILASIADGRLEQEELTRFPNNLIEVNGHVYWDIYALYNEIIKGLKVVAQRDIKVSSIGIDTWGVDFGLLDKNGRLLENPVHYRDKRNDGMIEKATEFMSKKELYNRTGIQFMNFNSVFQLLSLKLNRPELLERADKLLFMPDLLAYFLTGNKASEYSIATTSQLVDINTRGWSKEICDTLGLPSDILCDIVPSGAKAGLITKDLAEELGIERVPVVYVCGHDTQSAITAVPSAESEFAFISSGTWSLFGTEIASPIVNEQTYNFNVTNEGGYGYSTAFLKNICGLWLIQESRRQWKREGKDYSFAELENLAVSVSDYDCTVDPDAADFVAPGDMPQRIKNYCLNNNIPAPVTDADVVRCIYNSLAEKYRVILGGIEKCTGLKYDKLHIVGGGTKDNLLNSLTAKSCKIPVYAGPVEATVLGNVAIQLISAGELSGIKEARSVIASGEKLKIYE